MSTLPHISGKWLETDHITVWVSSEPPCYFRDGVHDWCYFYKDFDWRYDLCGCGWYRREPRGMYQRDHPEAVVEYGQAAEWTD